MNVPDRFDIYCRGLIFLHMVGVLAKKALELTCANELERFGIQAVRHLRQYSEAE